MYHFVLLTVLFDPLQKYIPPPCLSIVLLPPAFRCLFRVLDSFGTEPQFNFKEWKPVDLKPKQEYGKTWGNWNLNPRQFMTMYRKPGSRFL